MKDTLKELKTEFNAYNEALLAHEISKQTPRLASVHKVSQAILDLIFTSQNKLIAALETSLHVQPELLSTKMHGHLTLPQNATVNGNTILALLTNTLKYEKDNLAQLMNVHAFFIYRLYEHCESKDDLKKAALVKRIFHNDLFSNRKRDAITQPKAKLNPGILNNSTLAKKIAIFSIHKPKSSPKDHFKLNEASVFLQCAKQHNLPVACDVSGHTGSLLLGAILYGNLSQGELQEYITAAFSFLNLARAHTFHEVMIVGQVVGLPFTYSQYNSHLPDHIQSLSTFEK